jgi:hypothetical protein
MDPTLYRTLSKLLSNGEVPFNTPKPIEDLARKTLNNYQLDNNKLIRIDKGKSTHGGRQHLLSRTVIPKYSKLPLLKQIHNQAHLGQSNTYQHLVETYYWPGMKQDCIEYVRSCPTCQKCQRNSGKVPLEPIKKTPIPFYHIGIDIMGPLLPTTTGNCYIVLTIDHFSKWVEGRALKEADAHSIAVFLHDDIICRHGVPTILTSDRGTEFINELISALTTTFKIHHIKTTAYHPQGNGQVERLNRTIKDILAKITPKSGNWDQYLNTAISATRFTKSASTLFTPFEILHGFKPRQTFETENPPDQISPEEYAEREFGNLVQIRSKASHFITRAQTRQKQQHDGNTTLLLRLKIGDPVKLYRSIVDTTWSRKMEPKWEGPYYVQSIKGTTYRLRNPDGTILPKTFHRNKLSTYHERPKLRVLPGKSPQPFVEVQT